MPEQATPKPETADDQSVEQKQEASVSKRIDELQDLGMQSDPAALDIILSQINDAELQIREAAVSAAVQFGSRDAIPRLEEALARTDNPKDKATLDKAIEFLKLPTLTEALSQTNPPPGTIPVVTKP
jgi:HEAT repeat protein